MKKPPKTNPYKRWECDTCSSIYKNYFLNKSGGFCPKCGCECFTEVDRRELLFEVVK